MRRTASSVLRDLEIRVARLERQAKYDIEVQIAFKGRAGSNTPRANVEMYFETDNENLARMVGSHFDRNWTEGRGSPYVSIGSYVDERAGVDLTNVTIKLRNIDTSGNNGYFNFMKKVKKFLDEVKRNGFRLEAVSEIKY